MKVLFPTDLSEESFSMIHKLLPKIISTKVDTEIILFHVVDNSHYGATSVGNLSKILYEDATDKLFAEKELISNKYKVTVTPRVRDGYFDRELKWAVEKTNPDLVVLVSKAKHGVLKYINGQKSLKFVGELASPLLIIPEDFELRKISKMGLAIDENESPTLETLWAIRKLADYFESEISMFHVAKQSDTETDYYERMTSTLGFDKVEIVQEDDILKGIKNWIDNNQIDVLISMTHPKGFFRRLRTGSVTRDLVKENLTALLIITQ